MFDRSVEWSDGISNGVGEMKRARRLTVATTETRFKADDRSLRTEVCYSVVCLI